MIVTIRRTFFPMFLAAASLLVVATAAVTSATVSTRNRSVQSKDALAEVSTIFTSHQQRRETDGHIQFKEKQMDLELYKTPDTKQEQFFRRQMMAAVGDKPTKMSGTDTAATSSYPKEHRNSIEGELIGNKGSFDTTASTVSPVDANTKARSPSNGVGNLLLLGHQYGNFDCSTCWARKKYKN